MDGDLAPLVAKLRQLADRFDAWLMVDGAHSLYSSAVCSSQFTDVYVGTFSKAVGDLRRLCCW